MCSLATTHVLRIQLREVSYHMQPCIIIITSCKRTWLALKKYVYVLTGDLLHMLYTWYVNLSWGSVGSVNLQIIKQNELCNTCIFMRGM